MSFIKIYIAFSIHGTNTFITASKEVHNSKDLFEFLNLLGGEGFSIAKSRRGDFDTFSELKLSWENLRNKKTGKPLTSAYEVYRRMMTLRELGFRVDGDAFLKKHFTPTVQARLLQRTSQ